MIVSLRGTIFNFIRDQRGVTAIEYGLIASLVALAIIGGVKLLGTDLGNAFNTIAGNL